ncbi:MAG: aminopeptidase, partial [Staphylothermus sp.]|nr:aminopeptidase [Staphylothermus sp.]
GIRYGISPYTMGSDHDVFIGWSIDSVMYNEWPSKYYHTDKDTLEIIDPKNVAYTSVAAILAAELYFKEQDKLGEYRKLYEEYVRTWYRSQAIRNNFSESFLSRYLIKKPLINKQERPIIETPLLGREIYEILGREEFLKTIKIQGAYTYLGVYAPLSEKIGLKDHIKHFRAELLIPMKRKEEKQLRNAWEIIKSNINI